jgi:phosphoribosylformylglycinamidine cyclo-ligase
MLRTFNSGVGMVVCVPQKDVKTTLKLLNGTGETAWLLGSIEATDNADVGVEINGPLA